MEETNGLQVRGEMDKMFEYGDITQATPEQLQQFLRVCCTGNIRNESVHPREIVRGITINHLQMARVITELRGTIERLNAENAKKDLLITILAIVSLIATSVGIFT